jgi:Co/Zn/Cd efflux system component
MQHHDHDHDDHAHEHDHAHDGHDHGTSVLARIKHAASEFLGGHSHDAADQVDEALEADAAGRRALIISFVGLAITAIIQLVVVIMSGSVALLGDTLHNFADALTAIPLLIAFRLASKAATKRYTYG